MKLTCEQCGAQYSVSDSKIVGTDRVFKIRCKSCNAIMNIAGVASGDDDSPSSDSTADEAKWFYAQEGQQVGPVPLSDFVQAVQSGTVASNTYVWCSGMTDWLTADDVPEIADRLRASTPETAEPTPEVVEAEPVPEQDESQNDSNPPNDDVEESAEEASEHSAIAAEDEAAAPAQDELDKTIADDSSFFLEEKSSSEEEAPDPGSSDHETEKQDASEEAKPDDNDADMNVDDTTIFSLEDAEAAALLASSEADEAAVPEAEAPGEESDPGPRRTSTIDAIGQPLEFEEPGAEPTEAIDDADESPASADEDGPQHTIEQPSPWADYDAAAEEEEADTGATLDGLFMGDDPKEEAGEGDDDMMWERQDTSVLFSLSDLDEAPAPPSKRAQGNASSPAVQTDETTVESSLIDIGSFRKKKQSKGSRSDLFGALVEAEESAETETSTTSGFHMSPNSAVLPGVRRQRRATARIGVIAIAAAVLAGIGTAVAIWVFSDQNAGGDKASQTADKSTAVESSQDTTNESTASSTKRSMPFDGAAAEKEAPKGETDEPLAETKEAAVKGESAEPDPPAGTEATTDAPPEDSNKSNDEKTEEPVVAKAEIPKEPAKPMTPQERREARKKAKERAEKRRDKRKKQQEERAAKAAQTENRRMENARKQAEAARKKADKAKADKKKKTDLNSQLNNLRKKQKDSTGLGGLPARLTSGQIRRVVRRAYGSVRGCARAAGLTDIRITVKFTINGSGSVGGVSVSGPAAATSANGCVQGAIRRLRFPKFNGTQSVRFPFMVK